MAFTREDAEKLSWGFAGLSVSLFCLFLFPLTVMTIVLMAILSKEKDVKKLNIFAWLQENPRLYFVVAIDFALMIALIAGSTAVLSFYTALAPVLTIGLFGGSISLCLAGLFGLVSLALEPSVPENNLVPITGLYCLESDRKPFERFGEYVFVPEFKLQETEPFYGYDNDGQAIVDGEAFLVIHNQASPNG